MIVAKSAKVAALLRYVGRPLAALFAFDVAVSIAYVFWGWKWLAIPDVPLSIFGGVIGLIAGFRNNTSYARWWEARSAWGSIVNNSRSFARQVITMVFAPAGLKRELVLLEIAYVHALRCRMRETPPWDDLAAFLKPSDLDDLKARQNVPLAIHEKIAEILESCHADGSLSDLRWAALDRTLSNLLDAQGASERIKNTPLPRQYDMFLRVFIDAFGVLLPLGMVQSLGLLTPAGSTLVGFIFLALDQIGRDLEAPFENSIHDIPLTSISRTIEIDLKQMIGETPVPAPVTPAYGVLW
jgi:ion channel-forming bestrophin family protein